MVKNKKLKTLILLGGPMGVGKTSLGKELSKRIKNSSYIEGDLGWKDIPFIVNDENKRKVLANIISMIKDAFISKDVVILGWVMDQQTTIDSISKEFDPNDYQIKSFSILASREKIKERLKNDIINGKRKDDDVINRSLTRIPLFKNINSIKIDSTSLNINEVASLILSYFSNDIS